MKFVIHGGKKLRGTISVAGMKNAATPIIAATLLTDEECIISNVPRIADVETMLSILTSMGARVAWTGAHEIAICNKGVVLESLDEKLMKRLRSSSLFLGPFLARFSRAVLAEPGGCIIGNRPLGTHFKALEKFGCSIERINGHYEISRSALKGALVVLLEASVTATENVLMAASRAEGTTIIHNAACEPHVQDLAHFLQSMGASIQGIGTPILVVEGSSELAGARHTIIPDTIEAGTFVMMALATKSAITVEHARHEHFEVVLEWLKSHGARLDSGDDSVTVHPSAHLAAGRADFQTYPGLPSDLQAIFGVLATQLHGTSLIHEKMFEGRLGYIQEMVKMGANAVICDPHRVLVTGPTPLYGQEIRSFDLRAGAAMIIAGLIASGETVIHDAEIVDRGYERIEERLGEIGADIQRIE